MTKMLRAVCRFLCIMGLLFIAIPLFAAGDSETTGKIKLHSVQTMFTQEKHLEILVQPIISTGTMIFQAPDSLRWEYLSPVHSLLLMHDGTIEKFVERDGVMEEDSGMRLDSMQVILSEISAWLDGRFTDNPIFQVQFEGENKVLLMPKDEGFAALISRIELVLADQAGLLQSVTIFEGEKSYTRLTFQDAVLNKTIAADAFTKQ